MAICELRNPSYCAFNCEPQCEPRLRRCKGWMEALNMLSCNINALMDGSSDCSNPTPSATCTLQTRKQVHLGAFFFMCQRGLQAPSALRRLANRARSVSERPPSLSTRPSHSARRIQNPHTFQLADGIALRPCFAGSCLFQSRRRFDTGGVVVGMSWEFCAKSLMTNAVSAPSLARCQTGPGQIKRTT